MKLKIKASFPTTNHLSEEHTLAIAPTRAMFGPGVTKEGLRWVSTICLSMGRIQNWSLIKKLIVEQATGNKFSPESETPNGQITLMWFQTMLTVARRGSFVTDTSLYIPRTVLVVRHAHYKASGIYIEDPGTIAIALRLQQYLQTLFALSAEGKDDSKIELTIAQISSDALRLSEAYSKWKFASLLSDRDKKWVLSHDKR